MKFLVLVLLVLSVVSCTSYKYLHPNEITQNTDVVEATQRFTATVSDSIERSIMVKSLNYFFTHLKQTQGDSKWVEFHQMVMTTDQTVERSLIQVYDKTLYTLGIDLHYNTEYPYERAQLLNVAQVGFVNVQFTDSISMRDKDEVMYLLKIYCTLLEDIMLKDSTERALFYAKLKIMNEGYINMALISNKQLITNNGLLYSTANANSYYSLQSQNHVFKSWITSKYLNPMTSITFLHELIHAINAIKQRPLDEIVLDRNNPALAKKVFNRKRHSNIMLDEGLAEYVSRKYSLWSSQKIFESVHDELRALQIKHDFPWLSLADMVRYYYGKERRSFDYVEYGLTAAHSLTDYIVTTYGFEKAQALVFVIDVDSGAAELLGKSWVDIMADWKAFVHKR